jgi:hypothetical protein
MKNLKLWLIFFAVLLFAACRASPIYNVSGAQVVTGTGKQVSLDEVGRAITAAGAALSWQMKTVSPGNIVGTLNLRNHTAVVDVTYDTRSYSINYKDSVNLDYNGQRIHSNYNGWIQNLDRDIRAQLGKL